MSTPEKSVRKEIVASARLGDGRIVELLYQPEHLLTQFAVSGESGIAIVDKVCEGARTLIPYSAANTLLVNGVVRLPSAVGESCTEQYLIREIRTFIHRYVDLSDSFEEVAASYVLFTWIYDAFREVPYLRVRGDYGSGKSRFLLTIGSLCYKSIFCSGASSVSPIFRILDEFRGTLIMDESDFRVSDEMALIVKILNNGNATGFPVLRSELTPQKEFSPRAFHVFGPKVIATRSSFSDHALESRCITEELVGGHLRNDIPLNLPDSFEAEARDIRNKLLKFRFENLRLMQHLAESSDRSLEPRVAQIFAPLLATVGGEAARNNLKALARRYSEDIVNDRSMSIEAQLVEAIWHARHGAELPSVGQIAKEFATRFASDYRRAITPRWIGALLRNRLALSSQKCAGVFKLTPEAEIRATKLFKRYSIDGSNEN